MKVQKKITLQVQTVLELEKYMALYDLSASELIELIILDFAGDVRSRDMLESFKQLQEIEANEI